MWLIRPQNLILNIEFANNAYKYIFTYFDSISVDIVYVLWYVHFKRIDNITNMLICLIDPYHWVPALVQVKVLLTAHEETNLSEIKYNNTK